MYPLFNQEWLGDLIGLLGSLIRFLGMAAFGVGLGWLSLDLLRKSVWQVQIAVYLGLVGLVIALTLYLGPAWGALGAFIAGVGVALLLWGVRKPKEEDKEEKKEEKKGK